MILYSNGCSFTANFNLQEHERYPALLSQMLGVETISNAYPGSCNGKIIRCAMRDCIKLSQQGKKVFALIQLTFTHRTEYAGDKENPNAWGYGGYGEDDYYLSLKENTAGAPHLPYELGKLEAMLHNEEAAMTRLMSNVIGLTAVFKMYGINYLVFMGPRTLYQLPEADIFSNVIAADPKVLNFKEFNMLSLTGTQLHPTVSGMQTIANYFAPMIMVSDE